MVTADTVPESVARARNAQRAWAQAPYFERAQVLLRAADLLASDPDRLAGPLVSEANSSQAKASGEVQGTILELREAAALAAASFGEVLRSRRPRLSYARRLPYGVVGVIAPFNFPAILAMRSVAPALALGNAVVLKPDPRTGHSGGTVLAQLFTEAGLPEGVLEVLPGDGAVGAALVEHPDVAMLTFTGSTRVGRAIAVRAAELLKPVHLELGGNNALVVLADADVEAAARAGAWASFHHQGQVCQSAGRHFVHASLVDRYAERVARIARSLGDGDPTDPASLARPLITEQEAQRVEASVEAAVGTGATLLAGGAREGDYYAPTVLRDVPRNHPVFAEEMFGPVVVIDSFETEDEVVERIEDSDYGLVVSIFSADAMGALGLADRISAGIIHINDQTVGDEPVSPFGGIKHSGVGGRFGGSANLETFTYSQWVTVERDIPEYYPGLSN